MNISIDPEAALRAVSAESEWRRNRILILENEITRLSRENEALKAPQEPEEAAPADKPAQAKRKVASNGD